MQECKTCPVSFGKILSLCSKEKNSVFTEDNLDYGEKGHGKGCQMAMPLTRQGSWKGQGGFNFWNDFLLWNETITANEG